MNDERYKPSNGETYFMVSAYNNVPYEFVWRGDKMNLAHIQHHTLYRTREEAEEAIRKRNEN